MLTEHAIENVKRNRNAVGAPAATALAGDYLAAGTITTADYMYLVRWSEGRDKRSTSEWLAS